MYKNKFLIVAFLLTALLTVRASEEKYGKEITQTQKTAISKILAEPEAFEGKTILVEGVVAGVCDDKGCWIDLSGENPNEKIKVKVEDGVIVFPQDAKGKTALVEGVFTEVSGDSCEDEHASSEEDGCCSKEKKNKVYQIKGLGAVIK